METPALFPGRSDTSTALVVSLQEQDDYKMLEDAMLEQRKYMVKERKVALAERVTNTNINGCFDGIHQ